MSKTFEQLKPVITALDERLDKNVSDLKSALTDTTGNTYIPLVANKFINLSGSSVAMSDGVPQYSAGATAFSCGMMRCSGGDQFTVNGTGGGQPRLWGFVDSSGTILSVELALVSRTGKIVTAPTDSAWIIVHTNDGRLSYKNILLIKLVDDLENHADIIDRRIIDLEDEIGDCYDSTGYRRYYPKKGKKIDITEDDNITPEYVVDYTAVPWCAVCVPASEGDIFTISGRGGSLPLYGFSASDGSLLTASASYILAQKAVVKAPAGTAYFAYSGYTAYNNVDVNILIEKGIPSKKQLETVFGLINPESVNIKNDGITAFEYVDKITYTGSSYIDISGAKVAMENAAPKMTSNANWKCALIEAHESYPYIVNGTGGSQTRLWGFISADGTVIDKANANAKAENLVIKAPAGTKWLILHDQTASTAESYIGYKTLFTMHDSMPENYELGQIGISNGKNAESNTRARTFGYYKVSDILNVVCNDGASFSLRYYDNDKVYLGYSNWATDFATTISEKPAGTFFIRFCARLANDATITDVSVMANKVEIHTAKPMLEYLEDGIVYDYPVADSNTGNVSIRAAKEHTYIGTPPIIEYYLLAEPGTNRFYVSKDLRTKDYLLTFNGNADQYSCGITMNGDVIFVYDATSINKTAARSDSANRKNPYVFLASEKWKIQHEVDFGNSLKPCGWLSNYGYRVLPDGTILFCEYTRPNLETANVWKLTGNPLNPENWNSVLQKVVSEDPNNGFKHFHTMQYDHVADNVYMSSGDVAGGTTPDATVGAILFLSEDYGDTWNVLLDDSSRQVYIRSLNYIFTEDYIYSASDTFDTVHYLYRTHRDANGIMDVNNVDNLVEIPRYDTLSVYTICYMPEIEAMLLLERCDGGGSVTAPIRAIDLAEETIHTVGTMVSATGSTGLQIGFRTRYAEPYPNNCEVPVGFGLAGQSQGTYLNYMAFMGNKNGLANERINNLFLKLYRKRDGSLALKIETRYI